MSTKKTSTPDDTSTAEARVYRTLQEPDPANLDIGDIMHDLDHAFTAAEGCMGEARQIFGVLKTRASQLSG